MLKKYLLTLFGILLVISAQAVNLSVKETAFFRKDSLNNQLYQIAWIWINDSIGCNDVSVRFYLEKNLVFNQCLNLKKGDNYVEVYFPEITKSQKVNVELVNSRNKILANWSGIFSPQKKWTIHCVTYSHQDLGYGDIPHRLRRENRNANIDLTLKYCKETDDWPYDAKYRAVLETSEPLTTYMNYCSEENAVELKKRVEEGRIQIGGLHTLVNTETLSHELMARLFYLSNRHLPDMIGVPASVSANFDDIIGVTLPFFTYAKEAGIKNLFHGYNSPRMKFQLPAQDEPLYYMKAADGDEEHKVLVRSYYYSGDAIRNNNAKLSLGEDIIQDIIERYSNQNWPFDVLLSQDGWDFTLLSIDNALRIKQLNERYVYPRMICPTMDMFFADIRKQLDKYNLKSYQLDGNNQWADQPASDAFVLGQARILDDLIPMAEKLSSVNYYTGNARSMWQEIYQAYHRLLLYHEHTCGSSAFKPAYQYAVEREEIADMVRDAKDYCYKVLNESLSELAKKISLKNDNSLIVFNPINLSGVYNINFDDETNSIAYLVDNKTKKKIEVQNQKGKVCFVDSLPSLGYKTYLIKYNKKEERKINDITQMFKENGYLIENSYYKLKFDSITGGICSLYDKELSRELLDLKSPYSFNEYLYERYEVPGKEKESTFYGAEMIDCQVLRGNVSDVIIIEQVGEGCRSIRQEITLYKDVKKIDVKTVLNKSASGRSQRINDSGSLTNKEAIYIALPFDVPNYRFEHSLPGMKIEPIVNQFDSVSTASYAIRNYTSVYNDEFGIAVSPIEASMVQYGHPRSDAIYGFWGTEHIFEKEKKYPENSSIFMYLLNNMFDVNIILSQSGVKEFNYSITSYRNKEKNFAENFGWRNHNIPQTILVKGKQSGKLPDGKYSFVSVDKENVICTGLKLSEINGAGYILRFVETSGNHTVANIKLPLFGNGYSVFETDLVENNKQGRELKLYNDGTFKLDIPGFGVKTIRIFKELDEPLPIPEIALSAESDMKIKLTILNKKDGIIYKIFRSTSPDFEPSLLTYIGETNEQYYIDSSKLNYGNWRNNVLYPETTYYYKVVSNNNWNNSSEPSVAVSVRTKSQSEANEVPMPVSGLKVILVSDVSNDNYLNIHWRSNCEPDIVRYDVYRGETPDFVIDSDSKIGSVDITTSGNGSKFSLSEYDHQMFIDKNVLKNKRYYYAVKAVDRKGKQSNVLDVVSGKTKY